MAKRVLGIDIGVASVGWGIIDLEDITFTDAGVRLFREANAENNAKRRSARGGRRLKSRRVNRIQDLKKYLQEIGLITESFVYLENPLALRVRGLKEKLSKQELATCLLHICKNRGSSMEMVEDDEKKVSEKETTKLQLRENDRLIAEGKEVCEIQYERLEKDGKYHGHENTFRTSQYVRELRRILSHSELSDEIKENIITIICRRRMYYEGPGSYKSPTKYGRFLEVDGEVIEIDLIEKMRGKCSVFPDEVRAPKNSYSAEHFNFLNDLNNLTIDGEKISKEQKLDCLLWIDKKSKLKPLELSKLLDVGIEKISGFRIDKNQKELLTEFKGLEAIRKALKDEDYFTKVLENKQLIDYIIDILVVKKGIGERIDSLKLLDKDMPITAVEKLADISGISQYHSLSYKAIRMINEELLESDMNQMQIIQLNGLFKNRKGFHKGSKNIRFDEDAILSPVAKQAHREAIKVINQLRKKYGEFESIVIETTRAKNSYEEKKRIEEFQKYNEETNKQITELIGDRKVPADVKLKIRLYQEQQGKCLYTGEALDLDLIMVDTKAYEIDHIIPLSISLDDSINNKALVLHSANQAKGVLTPYQAFMQNKFGNYTYNEYKANVLNLYKINQNWRKKKDNLLFEEDISKHEVMAKFINRNLIDTSYANRVVLNTLQDYFKDNSIDTKVFTVKGSATSAFRKRIKLDKDREESYGHHAIDALIVAAITRNKLLKKIISNVELVAGMIHFRETGELWDITEADIEYLDKDYIYFIKKLHDLKIMRYSHKVDRKPNRKLADETIYSTRFINGEEKVIKKYKNIYEDKFVTLAYDIQEKNYEKYLMFHFDPKTFNKLVSIVEDYIKEFGVLKKNSKINPFNEYHKTNGYVTKYAKKDNGAPVISIKYYEDKLGNHIDISRNYKINDNKKVVILQISPYRTDFFKDEEGRYRFVTVRYSNLKYYQKEGGYIIDKNWYEQAMETKGISNFDDFQFSLCRNDMLFIESESKNGLYRFVGTNNDSNNVIEINPLDYYEKKQIMLSIGKKIKLIRKFHSNAIGDMFEIKKEPLKFFIPYDNI